MLKTYSLFLLTALLLFLFAVFVSQKDSSFDINLGDTYYIFVLRQVFLWLSGFAFLFSALYFFTGSLLYSNTWSIMHWICFVCLVVNIWSWGFVQRYYFTEFGGDQPLSEWTMAERLRYERISQFYIGSMLIMLFMQLVYFVNLIVGMIFRKTFQGS